MSSSPALAMVLVSGAYGLGAGIWFLMVPLLLSEYLGVERIAASYGLIRFFQSGANLVKDLSIYYTSTVLLCYFITFISLL